jgi:hypothetical protein
VLCLEVIDERLHIFLPPLLQAPFFTWQKASPRRCLPQSLSTPLFAGYIPGDEIDRWQKLGLTADPGRAGDQPSAVRHLAGIRSLDLRLEVAATTAGAAIVQTDLPG